MKYLYLDGLKYSKEADKLRAQIYSEMHVHFVKYVSLGFSPRDVAHIMHSAILDQEKNIIQDLSIYGKDALDEEDKARFHPDY